MLHVNKWRRDLFISWLILNCNEWLIHYITFLMILMGISALVCYYNSVLDRFWTTELHKLISTGSDRSTFCWFIRTLVIITVIIQRNLDTVRNIDRFCQFEGSQFEYEHTLCIQLRLTFFLIFALIYCTVTFGCISKCNADSSRCFGYSCPHLEMSNIIA